MGAIPYKQRRQAGLKSVGSWIRVKKIRYFQANFRKNRFFQAISQTISIFPGKFPKFLIFSGNFTNFIDFPSKIGHLQLLLGKLFYFSSKVTTLERTSCT